MILPQLEAELTEIVGRIRSSVVRIDREGDASRDSDDALPGGAGSGLIVDRAGLVVTNDHVVRGARGVTVTLPDGRTEPGKVLGEDPRTDLAVVRVSAGPLVAAALADSASLRVGQLALAVGNALGLPGEPTVSLGVVSALGRPIPGSDFIFEGLVQTDAAINPGNSGGPLAALTGEVIGVNTAVVPFAQGVGFAVPSNTVRLVIRQLQERGRVVRPWLGVSVAPLSPAVGRRFGVRRTTGLLVAGVVDSGPAADAGLRAGDVIFRLGDVGVRGIRDLLEGLAPLSIGGSVDVAFARGAQERRTLVRVREEPSAARGVSRGQRP